MIDYKELISLIGRLKGLLEKYYGDIPAAYRENWKSRFIILRDAVLTVEANDKGIYNKYHNKNYTKSFVSSLIKDFNNDISRLKLLEFIKLDNPENERDVISALKDLLDYVKKLDSE